MRLTEISNQDKTYLTLKGIEYSFMDRYNTIVLASSIIGKSVNRRNILINTIDHTHELMKLFFNEGYDNNDPDVLEAKDIFNKLQEIRNKL